MSTSGSGKYRGCNSIFTMLSEVYLHKALVHRVHCNADLNACNGQYQDVHCTLLNNANSTIRWVHSMHGTDLQWHETHEGLGMHTHSCRRQCDLLLHPPALRQHPSWFWCLLPGHAGGCAAKKLSSVAERLCPQMCHQLSLPCIPVSIILTDRQGTQRCLFVLPCCSLASCDSHRM